jgi:hypothetical protein
MPQVGSEKSTHIESGFTVQDPFLIQIKAAKAVKVKRAFPKPTVYEGCFIVGRACNPYTYRFFGTRSGRRDSRVLMHQISLAYKKVFSGPGGRIQWSLDSGQ